jgi:predicted RNase H-like HicB family nuclease
VNHLTDLDRQERGEFLSTRHRSVRRCRENGLRRINSLERPKPITRASQADPQVGVGSIVSFVPEQLDLMIVYEPGEDGWIVASIPEVKGVHSQGRTREEARANVIDALRLMLSPLPLADNDRREREALHLTIAG